MKSYQKTEKILSVISLGSFAIAVVSGVLSLIYKVKFLDTVAAYGLTVFITPFLLLQVAMSANFHTYGIKSMGKLSWFFYLIIFPFVNMWFFAGINSLYKIVPNYHLVDRTLRDAVREESMRQSWAFIGIIYISLIGIGFLLRFFKKPQTTLA